MERLEITSGLNSNNLENHNLNYQYLFSSFRLLDARMVGAENQVEGFILSANSILAQANAIKNQAEGYVETFNDTNKRLDNLIAESGTSDAEVIDARVDIEGDAKDTLKARIDAVEQTAVNASEKSALYDKLYGTLSSYSIPEKLNIDVPFDIQTSQNGEVLTTYDVAENKIPVTKSYYVDIENGDNSNDGTESEPFQSINRALRYGDADNIVVKSGSYGWSHGFSGYTQSKPFNLIGDGEVFIGAHREGQTWELASGYSNTYSTNASSVIEIADVRGKQTRFLDKKSSVDEVEASPNSYFIDTSSNIYVHTYNNRKPDKRILPNVGQGAVKLENIDKVYFENINFTNSVNITADQTDKALFAKNCQVMLASSGNGFAITSIEKIIFQNCIAEYAERDGFNYHVSNDIVPKAIEIDCIGRHNGRDGADQNNGSTSHDGSQVLRIRGEYHGNSGPNVIDVNDNVVSVNVGVHAHSSTATEDTISNSNFKNGNVGTSFMYLVNCVSNNSDYSVVTASSQGSVTEIENSLLLEPQTEV